MYFGYDIMWTLTFVPVAFVLVMAGGIALGLVYPVGSSKGTHAAATYVRVCTWGLIAALSADVLYGVVSGQFGRFLEMFGWTPLFEMGLLGLMFVGSMLLMAASYVSSKDR